MKLDLILQLDSYTKYLLCYPHFAKYNVYQHIQIISLTDDGFDKTDQVDSTRK